MSRPIIGHRSAEFQGVMERVTGKLKKIFQTENHVLLWAARAQGL
ncbi:hypothetical protein N752_25310 [Desulforamulus aquiferis]|nr:hypothetical protein N752_25310 [Desulforamulus aquiferis]